MTIAKRIGELESLQATRELAIAHAVAEFRGGEAELASLRAGVALRGELAPLARTEAILSVLRAKGSPLSPTEIVASLNAAGRSDDRRSVTATLDYLLKQRQVLRPSKGNYLAV
jgi:hypothetical protein